jgi:hypothetical protein
MASMDETAREAFASMTIGRLDEVLREAHSV